MADTPKSSPQAPADNYTFSSSTITGEEYKTVLAEREEFVKKQLAANSEFMYQHYARLLRAAEHSYERAMKANIVLERKERRKEAKARQEQLKAARKKNR